MSTRIDLAPGARFRELTVVGRDAESTREGRYWICTCSCGKTASVREHRLLNGDTKSCGHLKRKHGMHGTRTYAIWRGVLDRCLNANTDNFKRYGAKGITVAKEWLTFPGFLADMGERPPGLWIERIDGTKGYQPGNCVWATTKAQARNRSTNRRIVFRGEEMILADWCARFDLRFKVVSNRLRAGWSTEKALTTPTNEGWTNCQR